MSSTASSFMEGAVTLSTFFLPFPFLKRIWASLHFQQLHVIKSYQVWAAKVGEPQFTMQVICTWKISIPRGGLIEPNLPSDTLSFDM